MFAGSTSKPNPSDDESSDVESADEIEDEIEDVVATEVEKQNAQKQDQVLLIMSNVFLRVRLCDFQEKTRAIELSVARKTLTLPQPLKQTPAVLNFMTMFNVHPLNVSVVSHDIISHNKAGFVTHFVCSPTRLRPRSLPA